jgi:hypothetical protein
MFTNKMYAWDLDRIAKQPAAAAAIATDVADCLTQHAKEKAGQLVGGPMTADPRFEQLSKSLAGKYSACASKAKGLPLFMLNASLAEKLVRSEYATAPAPLPTADQPAAKAFYASAQGVTIDSLARCIAVNSPALVYRLVSAPAGSAEETKAMSDAYAQTPACGVSAAPADIPVAEQRAAFAVAMYSWMRQPR